MGHHNEHLGKNQNPNSSTPSGSGLNRADWSVDFLIAVPGSDTVAHYCHTKESDVWSKLPSHTNGH